MNKTRLSTNVLNNPVFMKEVTLLHRPTLNYYFSWILFMFKLHVYFRTKNNERFTFDNVWILMLDFPTQPHIRHIEFPTNTVTFAFSIWITGFKIYFIKIPAFNLKYNFLLLHEPAFPIKIIQNLYICWSIFPSNHRLSRPFEHATKVCEV